jgi:predicted ABC-type ATPase
VLREIYEASLKNLARAIREMTEIRVYDNSEWGKAPTLLLESKAGNVVYRVAATPRWLEAILGR